MVKHRRGLSNDVGFGRLCYKVEFTLREAATVLRPQGEMLEFVLSTWSAERYEESEDMKQLGDKLFLFFNLKPFSFFFLKRIFSRKDGLWNRVTEANAFVLFSLLAVGTHFMFLKQIA